MARLYDGLKAIITANSSPSGTRKLQEIIEADRFVNIELGILIECGFFILVVQLMAVLSCIAGEWCSGSGGLHCLEARRCHEGGIDTRLAEAGP